MSSISKFDFTMFDTISESGKEKLIGGFSASFSIVDDNSQLNSADANNCLGGNCTYACGVDQNIKCNAAAGCGN